MALDPTEKKAEDVIKAAEKLSPAEKAEVIEKERAGKNRATVLEALGTTKDPEGTIRSGTGRILGPQEADPRVAARANLGAQLAVQRIELAEDEATPEDTAGPGGGGGASTPVGTGTAPAGIAGAAGVGGAGATGGGAAGAGAALGV